jgi:hypothetical protein
LVLLLICQFQIIIIKDIIILKLNYFYAIIVFINILVNTI